MLLKKIPLGKSIVFFLLLILFSDCVDPVEPEFFFKEGLIYVDAFVSTSIGASYVSIYESNTEFRLYRNIFMEGASVSFKNVETSVLVNLVEQENTYVPPDDFVASVGETWELNIMLADGRQYQSFPEKIIKTVAVSNIKASYDSELFFNADKEDFLPGHSISISFEDPLDETNYYYWRFRSFEPLTYCAICYDGFFRNGACTVDASGATLPYYTYLCETKCFKIRFSENVELFSDEFVNGLLVSNLPVAKVPFYTKSNILVEVQQFSLSPSAHKYFNILKGIIDNSGGFNAPPPAALIGNVYSLNDKEEPVLGRFTAAASSIKSIFIDRSGIEEPQLEKSIKGSFEEPPGIMYASCEETRYSTAFTPEGWID